ncbi:MAG: cupin domain-containing protein [Kiritimatiellae bacterium]|nr:cupin domain-containing protein [Kiritimatiellia bacterium]
MEGLEVFGTDEPQYHRLMGFGAWRVAVLNHGERLAVGNLRRLERHTMTDEVFVLVSGSARLIVGEGAMRVPMEAGRVYNVKRNVWHSVETDPGAKLLVVENDDTGLDNTDYMELECK